MYLNAYTKGYDRFTTHVLHTQRMQMASIYILEPCEKNNAFSVTCNTHTRWWVWEDVGSLPGVVVLHASPRTVSSPIVLRTE
jgi:hypothetical protein